MSANRGIVGPLYCWAAQVSLQEFLHTIRVNFRDTEKPQPVRFVHGLAFLGPAFISLPMLAGGQCHPNLLA